MSDLYLRIVLSAMGGSSVVSTMQSVTSSLGMGGLQGALLATGVVAAGAAVALGVTAVRAAGNFQQSLTELVTAAGETRDNLAMVGDGIERMAIDTATPLKALTDGMFNVESAGFHGANGLRVLQASAEGAKTGQATLETATKALGTVMTDYHLSADKAVSTMNALTAASGSGKMTLEDLGRSMGSVLPIASSLGISFPQIGAAISVMTNAGMPAQRASMNLANAIRSLAAPSKIAEKSMQDVGLSAQQLKDTLSGQGLSAAIKLIEDHVGKAFPAGSVEAVEAFKHIMGGATGYNVALMLGGKNMESYEKIIGDVTTAMNTGGEHVKGWADVQRNLNFWIDKGREIIEVLIVRIGTQLLPVVTSIASAVLPVVAAFSDWAFSGHALSNVMAFINQHSQIMIPLLSGVAAVIGVLLVQAFIALGTAAWGAAVGVIAATYPFLLLAAAVAGAVAIFMHFYNNNAQFHAFIDRIRDSIFQLWNTISTNFVPAMQRVGAIIQTRVMPVLFNIGSFLASTFKPVWDQLVATFQTQLIPAWNDLMKALHPALPLFQFIGMVIGGLLIGAIVLLIGVIGGLVGAVAGVLPGLIQLFGGIVQVISGALQIILGIGDFFTDLFTGHFERLGADLGIIWNGIATIFFGALNIIGGIFRGVFGLIVGAVAGFFGTLNALFGGALGRIVGAIGGWFAWLFGAIGGFFASLWGGIVGGLQSAWNHIIAVMQGLLARFVDSITLPFRFIASLFVWLYQHNIYFQWLIDAITGIVSSGVAWLQGAWQAAINWIIGAWQWLVGLAVTLWGAISNAIYVGFSAAIGFVAWIWGIISSFFANAWGTYIAGPLASLWGTVSSFFAGVWGNYIAGPIGSLWASLSGAISGWAGSAYQWGANLIQGFINGILGMAQNVKNAANDIIENVSNILGFHSPAREGEGAHLMEWGPGLVKGFSQGMIDALPTLQSSLDLVMQPIASSFSGEAATPSYTPGGYASARPQTATGTTIIYAPVYNISTMARSRAEVERLVDMIDEVQSRRFHQEASGYSSGGIY